MSIKKKPWPTSFLEWPGLEVNQFAIGLEKKLHTQLDIAGTPSAIDFAITNLGAGLAKANGSTATGADGIPLGMVERVECFEPELKSGVFRSEPWECEVLV